MKRLLRYRYVNNLEDMLKIYDIADQYTTVINSSKAYTYQASLPSTKMISVVNDSDKYYKITTRYVRDVTNDDGSISYVDIVDELSDKYVCTWIYDKTGENATTIHPSRVSRKSNNVYKPYNIIKEQPELFKKDDIGRYLNSARPTIGYNPKFDNTEHNVVCYDLNSAYAKVLIDRIPDTYNYRTYDYVGKDEIGFMFDNNLELRYPGEYADYVMPLIDSPYKDYARKYYNIKKTAPKDSKERAEAKQILVVTVGLWQNVNPFLRAYVVNSCNKFINDLKAKYKSKVCMWNTDALYCTEHIKELDDLCGDDIGQFKIEYEGLFRQKGNNYQKIEKSITSYRRVMKMLFDEDYNILTDKLPAICLPYKMNEETLRIEVNEEFNKDGKKI